MVDGLDGFKQVRGTAFVLRGHLSEGIAAKRKAQRIRRMQMIRTIVPRVARSRQTPPGQAFYNFSRRYRDSLIS
jgi:hypothetical protein